MMCVLCSPSDPSGMNLIDSMMVPRLLMESGLKLTCDGGAKDGVEKEKKIKAEKNTQEERERKGKGEGGRSVEARKD